jgi:hypothetical protein
MPSIDALSLRIPVQSPTLIDIAGKRKQFLTCTEETTTTKLERLRSARLIHGDPKDHH